MDEFVARVVSVKFTQGNSEYAINAIIEEMKKKGYVFHSITASQAQFCLIFKRDI